MAKKKEPKDRNPLAELKERVAKLERDMAVLKPQIMKVKPAK